MSNKKKWILIAVVIGVALLVWKHKTCPDCQAKFQSIKEKIGFGG